MQDQPNQVGAVIDYRAMALAWVSEVDHRPDVEAIAKHLHANESLHLHDDTEGPEPCSYCWLRAAKAVQAIERAGRVIVAAPKGGAVPGERLLTPGEVARALQVDPKTVSRWTLEGKLRSIKLPSGHNRYRESLVHALLNGDAR